MPSKSRSAAAKKAWATRRKLYGKSGVGKSSISTQRRKTKSFDELESYYRANRASKQRAAKKTSSKTAKTTDLTKALNAAPKKRGRPKKTEHEKQAAYMKRALARENKYWNARQVPYDPNR